MIMTDANLRSIWNFAHKKTLKQFLQPMIEKVLGEGVDVPFLGSILPIFAYFCCILCVFHQKVKQCFGHKIFVMYN